MDDETPGWCRNLIEAGRLQPGEQVFVMVDEPLVEQGSQLAEAVRQAGGQPRLELWAGPDRPLAARAARRDRGREGGDALLLPLAGSRAVMKLAPGSRCSRQ